MQDLDEETARAIAQMVLSAVAREYPNKILHTLESDADVAPPRHLTPAFFGAYDWHSAVHGHWTLVRLCRRFPEASFTSRAKGALATSFAAARIDGERAYLARADRAGFELPYGIGWLLTLHAELAGWDDPDARLWRTRLDPLAELGASRLARYLERLPHPVRTGEHSQTAFGASLYLDWARALGEDGARAAAEARVVALYGSDRDGPLHLEPSGYDFLSPCLAEADLMRRVLPPADFPGWLAGFLPVPLTLAPPVCPDRSDGKLVHLDGLSASRAWMLAGIAGALPANDARRAAYADAARTHQAAALRALDPDEYMGSHWLGTFAVYLTTRKGRE